jgi:hypothetical protein
VISGNHDSLVAAVIGAVVSWWSTTRSGDALCDPDSDLLHDRDGALAHERDRHRLGAHALARDAAGGASHLTILYPRYTKGPEGGTGGLGRCRVTQEQTEMYDQSTLGG